MQQKPEIIIEYCPRCNWMLRSAWMAQEILMTFSDHLLKVALQPSETPGGFWIRVDGRTIWDRKVEGGFPDVRALKQRVRDAVAPDQELGHLDRSSGNA